ncbi:tripartite motif-containing protein 14 [Amia ocellicauda]|uniref:tripartite motif-containing protein 14 n=1 Tax=Amia ocellicauda TaxID=2972642 RepID=UPI003463AB92
MKRSQNIENFFHVKEKRVATEAGSSEAERHVRDERNEQQSSLSTKLSADQDGGPLTLDMNTAHPQLKISEELLSAERVKDKQPYPDHPDRFEYWSQVLSCQSFSSGTHHWEMEVEGVWRVGISYKSIKRRGKERSAVLGCNSVSRSILQTDKKELLVWHNDNQTVLPVTRSPSRVAVSLDYSAGSVSFYEAGDTLTHLHTFSTTFTQPVCLGFGVYNTDPHSRVAIVKK